MKHFFTMVLMIMPLLAIGQSYYYQQEEVPYIEVTGFAEKEVAPNEIYVGIILEEKYENRFKVSIESQEIDIKRAMKAAGIDVANLSVSDVTGSNIKVRWGKDIVLTRKEYTIKLSNENEAGKLFQELEEFQINNAYISKINYSKIESLKKEVKIAAISAAKNKADYLLNAIGEQTGKPLRIKDNECIIGIFPNEEILICKKNPNDTLQQQTITINKEKKEIQFQKIKVQTNISVKFSIK